MKNVLHIRLTKNLSAKQTPYKQLKSAMTLVDTEFQLVLDLKSGKRKAQEKFYVDYFPLMYPIAFRFSSSKEDAHEIINTAFLSVIKNIMNYSNDNFGGWVNTIVKRTAIDYYRKHKYSKPKTSELIEFDEVSYNEGLSNLNMEDILKLVQQLPNGTRTVSNLFLMI